MAEVGLIDVVREAQNRREGGAASASVSSFPVEPSWLIPALSSPPPSASGGQQAQAMEEEDGEGLVRECPLPAIDGALKHRMEEEERFAQELNDLVQQGQVSSLSKLEELVRLHLQRALPSIQAPSLFKLLKRALPASSGRFWHAILQAVVALGGWDIVLLLLEHRFVSGYSCPHLVSKLVEAKQAPVLCSWLRNVLDPPPSDLLSVLKLFLSGSCQAAKPFSSISQQWKRKASSIVGSLSKALAQQDGGDGAVDGIAGAERPARRGNLAANALLLAAAIDGFGSNEICLHYVVASGQDEVLLASIISQLDSIELLRLLRYLIRWLNKYSVLPTQHTFQNRNGLSIPTLTQVLHWVAIVLDGHCTTLVLCSEFHPELRALRSLIKEYIDMGSVCSSLFGITEHIRSNAALPSQSCFGSNGDHIIEYLEI